MPSFSRFTNLTPKEAAREWSAFDATDEHGQSVELRIIEPDLTYDRPLNASLLLQHWTLLNIARHESLRAIVELNANDVTPFVVLETVLNDSLLQQTHRDRHALTDAVALFSALAEVHRCGLSAGHVTRESLRVRPNGQCVIDLTSPSWNAPASNGNQKSLAPELQRGELPDHATDVFALCVLLLELSTGDSPADQSLRQALTSGLHSNPAQRPSAANLSRSLTDIAKAASPPHTPQHIDKVAGTIVEPAIEVTLISGEIASDPPVAANEAAIPEKLGRFRITDKLGAGAMGTVYRGIDSANGEIVAIKVLNSQIAKNPVSLRRFTKEARMLAQAGNPFVANLIESNEDAGLHFLAIEFVAGGTLTASLSRVSKLSETCSFRLVLDIARGLAVAHRQQIVHRDLKPDNILLTEAGAEYLHSESATGAAEPTDSIPLAKVSDFGLAREDQQSDSLAITHDGAILGTPLYMSPEQCRGQQSDVRSDIYSLGATLFQMLTGRPPFQGENHIAVMNAHCQEPLPSLGQLCPDLSDSAIAIVERCLAKNADARYGDATALMEDLQRLLLGEPASMQLHPATPVATGEIMQFPFVCDLEASPAQLWPYVSHTDRVNHALGLPAITYTTRTDPERGVERFAETKVAGTRLAWQEHPYEWIEGRRLSVLREFSTGPFLWFMSIIELQSRGGGGTRLTQTLKVVPRNWLGRLLAKFELGRRTPRNFSKLYSHVDQYLSQGRTNDAGRDAFSADTAITVAGRMRLSSRIERLNSLKLDPVVTETLKQYLEHASDLDVARIRPLVFAARFGLNPQQVIDACLLGAREGLLVLLWDVLCPSCKIPASVQETLASLKDHAFCSSCDLRYEVDFANSVELIFRAHPEIRDAETQTYCIGGPAFSAHVVAQVRLAAGERFAMELAMTDGSYRLRGSQLPFAVDFVVSGGGGAGSFDIALNRPPAPGTVPTLRAGSQVLTLHNNTSRELQVRLERSAGRTLAVTAAAAAAMPLFREMFPDEVLAPGQIVSVTSTTLLRVELCETRALYRQLGDGPAFGQIRRHLALVEETIRNFSGAVVKLIGDGLLATFADADRALLTAAQLLSSAIDGDLPIRMALHRGPALVTTINDRLDYFGETVHMTDQMLLLAAPGDLLLTASTAAHDAVRQAVGDQLLDCDTAPFMVPQTTMILYRVRRRL